MKVQIKSLIALAVLGYVFMLIIRYLEGIILSLLKIIGLVLNVNRTVFEFIDIIPQLLTIAFWLILIFIYLKKISWKIDLSNEFPKYFVVIIGVSTIT
ncbi:MAG: hypothetical protein HXX09_16835, partial [Bacteroidetes bacterium]|nr:hypothetical protein [Bacteroidota bacterium]